MMSTLFAIFALLLGIVALVGNIKSGNKFMSGLVASCIIVNKFANDFVSKFEKLTDEEKQEVVEYLGNLKG